MRAYTTKNVTIQAVQWDGMNSDDIADFLGSDHVNKTSDLFQVLNASGHWVDMHPGWWVSRSEDDVNVAVHVHSDTLFKRFWSEV